MQSGIPRILGQRILAVLTAFAVLAMGFNCTCAGMMARSADGTMPCCAHCHHGMHCRHQSSNSKSAPCSSECEHCAQTVMNDAVAHPSNAFHVDWNPIHVLPALLHAQVVQCISICFVERAALAPPATSRTLVSLHCALTI